MLVIIRIYNIFFYSKSLTLFARNAFIGADYFTHHFYGDDCLVPRLKLCPSFFTFYDLLFHPWFHNCLLGWLGTKYFWMALLPYKAQTFDLKLSYNSIL